MSNQSSSTRIQQLFTVLVVPTRINAQKPDLDLIRRTAHLRSWRLALIAHLCKRRKRTFEARAMLRKDARTLQYVFQVPATCGTRALLFRGLSGSSVRQGTVEIVGFTLAAAADQRMHALLLRGRLEFILRHALGLTTRLHPRCRIDMGVVQASMDTPS